MKRFFQDERGIAKALVVVLIVLGVIVVAVVGTAAVILADDLKITVTNKSCGNWDIAKGSAAMGLNFLPGINVPDQIAMGETAVVQVPRKFISSVSVTPNGSVELEAFGQSYSFGTASIDMQQSTWDGSPISGLAGKQVNLAGDHTLIMMCR